MAFRRILIAVDGSQLAAHAAEVGAELARAVGAELGFVHVVDPSLGYAPESGVPPAELLATAEEDGKRLLAGFQERGGGAAGRPRTFFVVGKPGHEIAATARDWPADVLVVGSHGRGGVSRVLLGSVAEGLMRHAPCPVLVVRGTT